MRRVAIVLSTVIFAVFLLTGCSEIKLSRKDKGEFLAVDDITLSKEEAIFALLEQKYLYEGSSKDTSIWSKKTGSGTMDEYVKEAVLDELTKWTAAVVMADKLGIYMTDEDKNAAGKAAEELYDRIISVSHSSTYTTNLEAARDLYVKKATYDLVFDSVTKGLEETITEESTKVIKVNYCMIPVKAGYDEVRSCYDQLKAGASFETVFTEAGYEPVMGQQMARGTMNSNFESVAFALVDGELSEIVESKDGYYIIQCVEDKMTEESAANYDETLMNAKNEKFNDYYINFAKEHKLSLDKSYWKKIKMTGL
ncbi:MAG: peptidyl-prolyl cis-trans isomerase [Lachnospiraceae bacterium]|nr:peptidyl-prolyl cis-trans isomerase [Lachnospiraceae bacterium]